MPRNLTASDRSSLVRLASTLPKGDETRRAILSGLKKAGKNYYDGLWVDDDSKESAALKKKIESLLGNKPKATEEMTAETKGKKKLKGPWDSQADLFEDGDSLILVGENGVTWRLTK